MDCDISFIPEDVSMRKKYEKVYKLFRQEDAEIKTIISLFGIEKSVGMHFQNFNMKTFTYVMKCMIILVKGKCENDDLEYMSNEVKGFTRADINKCFKMLDPKSQKYSLIALLSLAGSYKVSINHREILKMIAACPVDKVVSLDLGCILPNNITAEYTGIIPVISNNKVIFEYIHQILFGCNSDEFLSWVVNRKEYLCIDTGKTISGSKSSSKVDERTKLISSNESIFPISNEIVLKLCLDINFEIVGEQITKKQIKRKNIPKPVKNQLWRDHFGSNMKGNCYCCNCQIDALEGWEAGHIIAASKGGLDNVNNLRPVCSTCNKSMGNMHMDEYISKYFPKT